MEMPYHTRHQVSDRQILVNIRPMQTDAPTADLALLPLFRCGFAQ